MWLGERCGAVKVMQRAEVSGDVRRMCVVSLRRANAVRETAARQLRHAVSAQPRRLGRVGRSATQPVSRHCVEQRAGTGLGLLHGPASPNLQAEATQPAQRTAAQHNTARIVLVSRLNRREGAGGWRCALNIERNDAAVHALQQSRPVIGDRHQIEWAALNRAMRIASLLLRRLISPHIARSVAQGPQCPSKSSLCRCTGQRVRRVSEGSDRTARRRWWFRN